MSTNLAVHFSSEKTDWSTPQDFFDELNKMYHFSLDPCATKENAKCEKFFTVHDDGLSQSWQKHNVFMNPPYGRQIVRWMEKALEEWAKGDCTIVALVPARTDTRWFHDFVYEPMRRTNPFVVGSTIEIEFIRGRLKFGGAKHAAPFPSMLVIYKRRKGK